MLTLGLGLGLTMMSQSVGGGAGPTLPDPTGLVFMGDSRTAFSGGVSVTSTTWTTSQSHNNAVAGWFSERTGNKVLRADGCMYAVASSTSLRQSNALASASVASTGNPAQALTGISADANYNPLSSGEFSILDNPGNVVVYLPAVENDRSSTYYSTPGPIRSMQLIADMLDDLEAAGKIVLLGNEMPNGFRPIYAEAKTLSSNTTTAANTTSFSDGESWGVVGVINGDTSTPMTKVASAPGVGEYTVSGAGVYTFNASYPSKVFLTYCYGPEATVTYKVILHEWLQSAAPNFVGSNSVDYGVPGALHGRQTVFSFDTWGALLDPASGGSLYAKKGALSDTVHPARYGGLVTANRFKELVDTLWPGLPSRARRPTRNNWNATIASGTLGTVFQKLTLNPAPFTLPLTPGQQRVRLVSNLGSWIGTDDGLGKIVGVGFSDVAGDCTINYATGVITVKFASPANTQAASNIIVEQDYDNLLSNGLFDGAQGTNALPAGVTGDALPNRWALTLNAELSTALTTGKAAGGIDISHARVTAPDGTPGIEFTIDGNPGGGTATMTLQPSVSLYQPVFRFPANSKFRAAVNARIDKGANGKLYGLASVALTSSLTSSSTFTRPYNANNLSAVTATVGGGSASSPYSDQLLIAGDPLDLELLTDALSTIGMTPSALTHRVTIVLTPNAPNSAKVTLWATSVRIEPVE